MNINDLLRFQDDNSKQLYLSTIGDLSGVISNPTTGNNGSYLVSGGQVIWRTGLDFTITAATYYILGTFYESPETDVTLSPADATNDRIDTFYVNTSSTAGVITGTPSSDPQETSVDPETQLRLTIVLIESTATTPSGVSNEIIYDEDAGTPSEWATSTNNATVVDFADTADPANNTIHTTISANNTSYYMRYTPASAATINAEEDKLVLSIKLLERFRRNQFLSIQFYDPTAGVILNANLRPGQFGLDGNNTSTYQEITIPIIAMYPYEPVTYTGVSQLTIVVPAQTDNLDYQLDYIYLQKGITSPTFGNADSHHIFKNTIWVDGNGNDDTGEKGEFNKPFATIKAAENIASSGDTIIVMPGTYTEANLGKEGVHYYLNGGATLQSTSGTLFTDGGSGITFYITGEGTIKNSSSSQVLTQTAASNIVISCDNLEFNNPNNLDQIRVYGGANSLLVINVNKFKATGFRGIACEGNNTHNPKVIFRANYIDTAVETFQCTDGGIMDIEFNKAYVDGIRLFCYNGGGTVRMRGDVETAVGHTNGIHKVESSNIGTGSGQGHTIYHGNVIFNSTTPPFETQEDPCIFEFTGTLIWNDVSGTNSCIQMRRTGVLSVNEAVVKLKDATLINKNTSATSHGISYDTAVTSGAGFAGIELTNTKILLNSTAVAAGARGINVSSGALNVKAYTDIGSNGDLNTNITNLIPGTALYTDSNIKSD